MDNSEELSHNVEQLVEYVSNLVLSTVTGQLSELNINCEGIAEYTDKVVLKAKDIAIESHNKEIQIEITNCINAIASSIQDLVVAFTNLLPNINDPEKKKNFALSAKNVGISINQLIVTVDLMSSKRILPEVEVAKDMQQLLLKSYNSPSRESFFEVLRNYGQQTIHIVALGTAASSHTADRTKSTLLKHAIDDFKTSATQLMHTTKSIREDQVNEILKSELVFQYKNVLRIYNDIVEAANIIPDFSGKLNDAYDKFNKMLSCADALRYATQSLVNGVQNRVSDLEFTLLARQALQNTMNLLDQAQRALDMETDPTRRAQIELAIQEVKDSGAQFIKNAKLAQQDPNDRTKVEDMKNSKAHLDEHINKLVALTSKGMEEQKLFYTGRYLEDLIEELMRDSPHLSAEELMERSNSIANATERFNKDAKAIATKTNDPNQRERILNSIVDLRKVGDRFISDIKNLAKKPGDHELLDRLVKTQKLQHVQIHKVLQACGLEEEHVEHVHDNDSDELVIAAKEQVKHALILAADAERMAHQMDDPVKKSNLLKAINILRQNANDVIHRAKIASGDPNNLEKQIALDESQRLLADNIKDVIMLTSTAAKELDDLLKTILSDDDVVIGNIFEVAQKIINDILNFIQNSELNDPQKVVMEAKDIANITNQLSVMVRKLADSSTDPKEKEQLIQFSRFMRDRATQVKMLAAVKAASGGQDTGQVTCSADGLKNTVTECVSFLRATELKRRRKATTERAQRIREVVALWQKLKKK